MLFNFALGIYCFYCNQYIDPYLVFLNVQYEGSICCDKEHILGNQSDLQWKEFWNIGENE
jgi:hypothetical protein